MSVDRLSEAKAPVEKRPVFLDVKPGMTVIVRDDYLVGESQDKDWWMGQLSIEVEQQETKHSQLLPGGWVVPGSLLVHQNFSVGISHGITTSHTFISLSFDLLPRVNSHTTDCISKSSALEVRFGLSPATSGRRRRLRW
ncbi:hypothetical protein SynBIOSE41_03284 [Synechococcus sp. BIOS-E4-1]|uniref:DUF3104 domain-containing protein n=1 Tax=Synechococcus sp. BIOS-E4-1 TaxID=1400864 RepID=UPI00164802E2|nr:DUF3104 domain-containing protein [Synechococcus sp. BIOS-E4-1]QNI55764.1 hypothetical protein SynBIOSE41_03284 [Synechococcus sp. BIOS-E4-1]